MNFATAAFTLPAKGTKPGTAEVMDIEFDTSGDSVPAKKRKTLYFDCSSTASSEPGQNQGFPHALEEFEVKKFEEQRDRILESYPEDHKAMFNEVGFVKHKSKQHPAMVINPFDVAPGDVRQAWAAKYIKVSKPWSTVSIGDLTIFLALSIPHCVIIIIST